MNCKITREIAGVNRWQLHCHTHSISWSQGTREKDKLCPFEREIQAHVIGMEREAQQQPAQPGEEKKA